MVDAVDRAMRITAIITVYNLEKFIDEALSSVLLQTRQPDEIVVVDDGSTDNSATVLQKYSDKIRYVRLPTNRGALLACIEGIKHATGDVLAFLDGDDIWHPRKLEEVEKAFVEDERRILVTHDYECIDGDGNGREYSDDPTHYNTARIVTESQGDSEKMDSLLRNSILSYKGVWLGSAFSIRVGYLDFERYKKWVLSLPFSELSHQDQPLAGFICVNNQDHRLFFLDKILFKYRIFSGNSSGTSTTLPSALRTINRSRATIMRTKDLLDQQSGFAEEKTRVDYRLMENDFIFDLYSKKYGSAIGKFCRLVVNFWDTKKSIKETKRFASVLLLGPETFLKLKSRRV